MPLKKRRSQLFPPLRRKTTRINPQIRFSRWEGCKLTVRWLENPPNFDGMKTRISMGIFMGYVPVSFREGITFIFTIHCDSWLNPSPIIISPIFGVNFLMFFFLFLSSSPAGQMKNVKKLPPLSSSHKSETNMLLKTMCI